MHLEDFAGGAGRRPHLMAFTPREAPHFTIETNKSCNIRCRNCYSRASGLVKSRAEIGAELDFALTRRNAGVVTLLGGEPTLHPELPGIVKDAKARGLRCQLLTNGRRFMDEDGGALLDALAGAGLDRVLVHIDGGQAHLYPDLDAARRRVFDMLEERGLRFGLSLTIYEDSADSIAALLKRYAEYRRFDGILAVLARDLDGPPGAGPRLDAEYARLRSGLGIEPCAYLPSNTAGGDVRWLVYFLHLKGPHGRAVACPPWLYALSDRVHRFVHGCRMYAPALRPGFRFIAIQTPPEMDIETGGLRLCRSCPDATVRNGRMTPVCIADRISPLQNPEAHLTDDEMLMRAAAYSHLGEPLPL